MLIVISCGEGSRSRIEWQMKLGIYEFGRMHEKSLGGDIDESGFKSSDRELV